MRSEALRSQHSAYLIFRRQGGVVVGRVCARPRGHGWCPPGSYSPSHFITGAPLMSLCEWYGTERSGSSVCHPPWLISWKLLVGHGRTSLRDDPAVPARCEFEMTIMSSGAKHGVAVAAMGALGMGSEGAFPRALAISAIAGALVLGSVAASSSAHALHKGALQALAATADGYPDLSKSNLRVYQQEGVTLKVIPVDPKSKVMTQDYFVVAKGFTGPVKVRVDGWALRMNEWDIAHAPELPALAEAAVQEFIIPGDGKHRITVTHPFVGMRNMIHAKAGDKRGHTAGTRFEANAFFADAEEQEMVESADGTEMEAWFRPWVRPAR